MDRDYGEDLYSQQKEWEEEQARLDSASAEAIADAEAQGEMEMDKPTKEQIKEFWEWCGFSFTGSYWRHPKGWYFDSVDAGGFVRDGTFYSRTPPHLDLNNLFKYAVPKLNYILVVDYAEGGWAWFIRGCDGAPDMAEGCHEDPALALFWALWQVKKEVENG